MAETGVIHSLGPMPPMGPGPIASSLKSIVHQALGELPPGSGGAAVTVTSDTGINLVFAHRGENGHWQVDAFVGKTWAKDPLSFGASAKVLW